MADPILDMINEQRECVARLRAQLAEAENKLQGMEMVYAAMPKPAGRGASRVASVIGQAKAADGGGAGGRQPGSISMRWREILRDLYRHKNPFTADDAAEAALRLQGRTMKPSEARRIIEGYEDHGYIVKNNAGQFVVTDAAAAKFDFVRPPRVENTGDDFSELLGPRPLTDTVSQVVGNGLPSLDELAARAGDLSRMSLDEYRGATARIGEVEPFGPPGSRHL